jgi:selenocysteine lyase/cysteine desulfurase
MESGTPNTVGLAGLAEGLKFIMASGTNQIRRREESLVGRLLHGLQSINGCTIYGTTDLSSRAGLVTFNLDGIASKEVSAALEEIAEIGGRAGLHCAPLAHKTLGTTDIGGAMRLAPGVFNTEDEIDRTLDAVEMIVGGYRAKAPNIGVATQNQIYQ